MNREHARRIYNFQQIKQVPVTAVLERYGRLGDMKRIGAQLFGSCPIHRSSGRNKKQFVVDPAKNVWKCFGDCADRGLSGGSTIDLVSAIERIEARAAAELIAQWFAIGTSTHTFNHRNQQRRRHMSGERPSHKCFVVEDRAEGEDKDGFWTRIGSAWPHKDGKGLNLQLAALPANGGRIVLREFTEADAKEEEQQKIKRKK